VSYGGAREARKREADLEFLARCVTATEPELLKMLRDLGKNSPEWKRVAVKRALSRIAKARLRSF
jgi:hypothetical protein